MGDAAAPPCNEKVGISVDITANWSPVEHAERDRLCFGIWGWWRRPDAGHGWEPLGTRRLAGHGVELRAPARPPDAAGRVARSVLGGRGGLAQRRGDLLVPPPWSPTISDLLAAGVRGVAYAHEIIAVEPRRSPEMLGLVRSLSIAAYASFDMQLVRLFTTADVRVRRARAPRGVHVLGGVGRVRGGAAT